MDDPIVALGIDFGLYHMGTAIGQNITQQARALKGLSAEKGKPHWPDLDALIQQWQPHYLVVGMPYQDDGSHQPITHATERFMVRLQQRYPQCTVVACDERYTTQLAKSELMENPTCKTPRKDQIDCQAAKLILEAWLLTKS